MFKAMLCAIFAMGQMNTLQPLPVVHLQPNKNSIEVGFNGSQVELINSPNVVHLPPSPPKPDLQGVSWFVDVRNFGPAPVTIKSDRSHFQTVVNIGQSIQIKSNGSEYLLQH